MEGVIIATKANKAFKRTKTVGCFTPFTILANNFLPVNTGVMFYGGLSGNPNIVYIFITVLGCC